MSDTASAIAAIRVEAASLDRQIRAAVSADRDWSLVFQPGTYRRYAEPALGYQLAQLAAEAVRDYSEAVTKAVARMLDEPITDDATDFGSPRREYRQALQQITVRAESEYGDIRIEVHGLTRWQITIARRTVLRLTEQEFVEELRSAVTALLSDYDEEVIRLKDRYYGFGFPITPAR